MGTCVLSANGSLTVSLSGIATSAASLPINVQSTFGLSQGTDGYFEPTLGALILSASGQYKLLPPWAYEWSIGIGPLNFGVEAAITAVPNIDIYLPYKADVAGTSLGLPLSLSRGSRVNTPIALDINGETPYVTHA